MARHANLSDLANVAIAAPTTPYRQGSTQVVEGPLAPPTGKEVTLIAECPDARAANELFATLKGQIPAAGTFRVFGQTLLLALPANDSDARKQWSMKLEPSGESVVVDSDLFSVPVTVLCIAPDVRSAEAIKQDFNDYAMGRQFKSLVSPWSTEPRLSPEQKRARKTLRLLTQNSSLPEDQSSALDSLRKRTEAVRRGDKDAVEQIDAERKALRKKQWDKHIQSIRSLDDVDQELIEIYTRQPMFPGADGDEEVAEGALAPTTARDEFTKAYSAWCDEMAPRLGQLPRADGEPGTVADRYGTKMGFASHAGLLLRFDVVQFNRPVDGVPGFAEWLYSQNCVDLKYRMGSEGPAALPDIR